MALRRRNTRLGFVLFAGWRNGLGRAGAATYDLLTSGDLENFSLSAIWASSRATLTYHIIFRANYLILVTLRFFRVT